MKRLLPLLFFISAFKSQAQTYSTLLKDSEIVTLIVSIGETLKANKLNSSVSKWSSDEVFGARASKGWPEVIGLMADDTVKKYFTKPDIGFIREQYNALIQAKWLQKDLSHFRLIDSVEVHKIYKISMNGKNRMKKKDSYFYEFSIPFFSLDRKMAIIKTTYNCGFLCSSECATIYKISEKGEWVFVTRWNCLSD